MAFPAETPVPPGQFQLEDAPLKLMPHAWPTPSSSIVNRLPFEGRHNRPRYRPARKSTNVRSQNLLERVLFSGTYGLLFLYPRH